MVTTGSAELDRAIISLVVTTGLAYFGPMLRPKAAVRWLLPHIFTFKVAATANQAAFDVFTATLRIENWGRANATNIQIIHQHKPMIFEVWPPLEYHESSNPNGNHIITIASLAAQQGFAIELLSSTRPLPELLAVRSDGAVAQKADFTLNRYIPKPIIAGYNVLAFIGIGTIIYLMITAVF